MYFLLGCFGGVGFKSSAVFSLGFLLLGSLDRWCLGLVRGVGWREEVLFTLAWCATFRDFGLFRYVLRYRTSPIYHSEVPLLLQHSVLQGLVILSRVVDGEYLNRGHCSRGTSIILPLFQHSRHPLTYGI